MKSFLDKFAHGLALVAKGAGKAALFLSEHPQVIATVASVAKLSPAVTQAVTAGIGVAGAVDGAFEQ